MSRVGILLAAIVVLGLAVANIILGQNLITPLALARERGAGVPWYIVWALILLTAACAVALGGLLLAATVRKK